jgi:molecular chaperone GrpE
MPQDHQPEAVAAPTEAAAAPADESAPIDPVAELEALRAAWEAERNDLKDRLMRALAEVENTRKRAERDRREAAMYGAARFARDILPVYDHLSRALSLIDGEVRGQLASVVEGIDLTLRELTNVMARHGIERINPEPGTAFDPHQHEAMFESPLEGFAPGSIIQVVAEGFRMHDQLLRPAKVGVAAKAQ